MIDIEDKLVATSTGPRITPKMLDDNIESFHFLNAAVGIAAAQHTLYGLKVGKNVVKVVQVPDQPPQELPIGLGLLTICVIVLKNGFTVTGESACASPENYNQEIGQKIAFENAKQKIWPLMGYALRDHLTYDGQSYFAQPTS